MVRLIDTHVHLDFYDDPMQMAQCYESHKVYAVFVTHLPELFKRYEPLYSSMKYVRLAVGYHPHMFGSFPFDEAAFFDCIQRTKYIGEVGLEGGRGSAPMEEQLMVFRKICTLSSRDKLLSIHSRKAESEVLDVMVGEEVKFAIFHWYTGSVDLIDDILDAGYYFSVNSSMVNSSRGKRILGRIPIERVLVETDGPFTKIDGVVSHPKFLHRVYEKLGDFYDEPDIGAVVFNNFRRLLKQLEGSL